MDFGGHPYTLAHLIAYTTTAAQLGFGALSVNDHMVFSVPWLDGPVALAAVMEHSEKMTLATTVALAVVRGPVPAAKTLGAIDRLSGGRLLVAVGPGSSAEDYAAVGTRVSNSADIARSERPTTSRRRTPTTATNLDPVIAAATNDVADVASQATPVCVGE
jgi:alkanesulfonate monooxygenase SsuD/methylene tetrahydromethanopterin reductase-like flavin-dependent oxidoreductase (luciferase family)